MEFSLDPSVLPQLGEKKGSLLLRSNHMNYKRGVLVTRWHDDREALPMDYDVSTSEDKNLSKGAYNRLGNLTDGSMKDTRSTQQAVEEEVQRLEPDYRTQEIHKRQLTYDNFADFPFDRDTGRPECGYGSVLPRHPTDHKRAYMVTTHSIDYKYPYEWTPKDCVGSDPEERGKFRRLCSEFVEKDGYKTRGINTFKDSSGPVS